mgnify:CR=1 FL=1
MRADAQRNVKEIRRAAIEAFREKGLTMPLAEVANHAGVSKGTIYHRFGGRSGLIDEVVDELVAPRIEEIISAASSGTAWERLELFLVNTWMLQFDDPVARDVLSRRVPESKRLNALCDRARTFSNTLLSAAQAEQSVSLDVTPEDLYYFVWANSAVLSNAPRQDRTEYIRRTRFWLNGIRP